MDGEGGAETLGSLIRPSKGRDTLRRTSLIGCNQLQEFLAVRALYGRSGDSGSRGSRGYVQDGDPYVIIEGGGLVFGEDVDFILWAADPVQYLIATTGPYGPQYFAEIGFEEKMVGVTVIGGELDPLVMGRNGKLFCPALVLPHKCIGCRHGFGGGEVDPSDRSKGNEGILDEGAILLTAGNRMREYHPVVRG